MRITIIGALGQLGTELQSRLAGHELTPVDRPEIDIVDPASVAAFLAASRPELVINCAAYNLVDRAEDEPHVAYAVNALGPRNLALWCEQAAVPLLHVGTDYVFSGSRSPVEPAAPRTTPYAETDAPGPLGAYAASKLAGEHFVQAHCRRHYVVRTCGLYGRALGTKGNFVETMLRLGRERPELRVVADQHCTPTSAADLAQALTELVATDAYGLYHATSSGETTWHGLACEIFRQSGMNVTVAPITSAEYPTKARRPGYSVLDGTRLAAVLGRPMPPWQDALARYLATRDTI